MANDLNRTYDHAESSPNVRDFSPSQEKSTFRRNHVSQLLTSSQIKPSSLNNSKSKFMFSFAKCPRNKQDFTTAKKVFCDKMYDLRSDFDKNPSKGTSFGFGKIAGQGDPVVEKRASEPGPTHYRFNSSAFQGRGAYMGQGREIYKKVYIKSNPPVKGWTDPCRYQLKSFVEEKTNRRYFFGARLKSHGEDMHKVKFPGPAHY